MAKSKSLTETTTLVYELLFPLKTEERYRVWTATMALLGDTAPPAATQPLVTGDPIENARSAEPSRFGDKANSWMRQHQVSNEQLDQLYHIDNGSVELIATNVPGKSLRIKTINCYLLAGIRSLLATDEAKFADREAIEFCHLTNAYDKNNHTTNRTAVGNRASGDRASGFTLTVPGLRDAAKLIKEMGA